MACSHVEDSRIGPTFERDDCAPGLDACGDGEGGEHRRDEKSGAEKPGAQVTRTFASDVPSSAPFFPGVFSVYLVTH